MKNPRRINFDEALVSESGAPLADSQLAHKILTSCSDSLDGAEMGRLIDILGAVNLLTKEEAKTLNASVAKTDKEADPQMAGDRALRTVGNETDFYKRFPDAAHVKIAY